MQVVRRFFAAFALFVLGFAHVAQAEGKSIIILDGSGSMWGQIDGKAKLEIARTALDEVLASVPPETELGFMAYGHREKGSCDDIELMVAPAKGTGPAIASAAAGMKFLGKTPLSEAVRRAAGELRSTEEKATVILITDGIETCEADPCALGAELEASGVDFTAHVVGFGLTADEGKQVACLAENTGGKYIEAKDATSLADALKTAVVEAEPAPAPEPEPAPAPVQADLEYNIDPKAFLAAGGPEFVGPGDVGWKLYRTNADGTQGELIDTEYNDWKGKIAPGTYILSASIGRGEASVPVTLTADALATPEVVVNVGIVELRPTASEGGTTEDSAGINFVNDSGLNSTEYGETRAYLPAGPVRVTASLGAASVTETLNIVAGETIKKDMVIGSGVAVIDGYYVEGTLMDGGSHAVLVRGAKKKLDGSSDGFGTTYGAGATFNLPGGDYVAVVTNGAASAEVPFTVKVGERVEVPVILNAGVLYVAAPGASSIEIFDAKKSLDGNRTSRSFDYAEEVTLTATAGDYVAVAKVGEELLEKPLTVTAGERVEITIP